MAVMGDIRIRAMLADAPRPIDGKADAMLDAASSEVSVTVTLQGSAVALASTTMPDGSGVARAEIQGEQ